MADRTAATAVAARPGRRRALRGPAGLLVWLGVGGLLLLLVLPVAALLGRAAFDGLALRYLGDPTVGAALRLSLGTSAAALLLAIALGTPTAYLIARRRFPGRTVLDALVDAPLLLPPAVAGLALLLTFGRRGLLGPLLESAGVELAFTTLAVVLAQAFVATPFYVRSARAGFAEVDHQLEEAAGADGAGPFAVFTRITVPLALPSLVGGAIMAWARALGEFGATIMFAGSAVGRTQTMPLAIYQALESDLNVSLTLAAILVVVSLALLVGVRLVAPGAR